MTEKMGAKIMKRSNIAANTTTTTITDLFNFHVLMNIFIRLPLDSILECRKVCKSWNVLICEAFFAKEQRSISPLRLIVVDTWRVEQESRTGLRLMNLSSSSRGLDFQLEPAANKVLQKTHTFCLVGSCNGLVCLTRHVFDVNYKSSLDHFKLVLHNPILGNTLSLPDPPKLQGIGQVAHFGFGYVPSTGNYKAVKVAYRYVTNALPKLQPIFYEIQPIFYVCTIRRGAKARPPSPSFWRKNVEEYCNPRLIVGKTDTATFIEHEPAFLNGSIIWISNPGPGEDKSLIYFDVEVERPHTLWLPQGMFREPDNVITTDTWILGVGVYYDDDGNNHLYIKEDILQYTRIWVMEEWKCIDSLKLKWVIRAPEKERVPLKLLKVFKDGTLLVSLRDSRLAYYDSDRGVFEQINALGFPRHFELAVDIPSLLGCMI